MLEYIIVVVSASIGGLMGAIGTYVMVNRLRNKGVFLDIFEDFIDDMVQNEDMQKKIYLLGGIVGSGIRQGVGLTRGKGKMKLEDILMQLVSGYIQKNVLPQPQNAPQEATGFPI